jgi:hypothetical protein
VEDERIAVVEYESSPDFLRRILESKAKLVVCSGNIFGKVAADIDYFQSLFQSGGACEWVLPERSVWGAMIFPEEARQRISEGEKVIVCLSDDGSDWDEHIKIMAHLEHMKAKIAFLAKVK